MKQDLEFPEVAQQYVRRAARARMISMAAGLVAVAMGLVTLVLCHRVSQGIPAHYVFGLTDSPQDMEYDAAHPIAAYVGPTLLRALGAGLVTVVAVCTAFAAYAIGEFNRGEYAPEVGPSPREWLLLCTMAAASGAEVVYGLLVIAGMPWFV